MRMKSSLLSAVLIGMFFLMPRTGSAQFSTSTFAIGPHLGLGGWGGTTFGAYGEKGITKPGEVGPGILGISGRVDYSGWSDGEWTWYVIAVGAFVNYHFKMESTTWDPFVSLGLAYEHFGYSGPTYSWWTPSWSSGIYIAGNAGIRYFFNPNIAARALVGFGLSLLALGVDFVL